MIVSACTEILRKDLQFKHLGFEAATQGRTITRYLLQGSGQESAIARDRYPVHLLCVSNADLFWIAVSLETEYKNPSHQLINVQLVIFRGDRFAVKTPYLRAEWHCSETYLKERHAQPHWHVYIPVNPRSDPSFEDEQVREFGAPTPDWPEFKQLPFHFAMAARWSDDPQGGCVQGIVSIQSLTNWLKGCNVQMLAHNCWEELRSQGGSKPAKLTVSLVQSALKRTINSLDPYFAQMWNQLTPAQQKALTAFVHGNGEQLSSSQTAQSVNLSVSSLQSAFRAPHAQHILWKDSAAGKGRVRFEDPFFAEWIGMLR